MRFSSFFFFVRLVFGILLIVGGVVWFLPVVGLWMFPLGVLLIATCIPYIDRRIRVWTSRLGKELQEADHIEADVAPPEKNK